LVGGLLQKKLHGFAWSLRVLGPKIGNLVQEKHRI